MINWKVFRFLPISVFAFFANLANADTYGGTTGSDTTLLNPLAATSFPTLVEKILLGLIAIAIPICTIMVIVGGYYIMAAAGNEERLKTGRNTIFYAAIGFIVILIASGVSAILRSLVGV